MIEPILVIATIIMILLMGSVVVLAVIFAQRKRDALHKHMRTLSVLLLVYMLCAFLQFYFRWNQFGAFLIKSFGCLGDIFYCLFIVSWIQIVMEFSGKLPQISVKAAAWITALYGISAELIVIFTGSYDADIMCVVIAGPVWRRILLALNGAYAMMVLLFGGVHFVVSFRTQEKGYRRNGALFFSGMLVLYMVWVMIFDFLNVHQIGGFISTGVVIDPLFIVYCFLDIAVICFFFKKDPLSLFATQNENQQEAQLVAFAGEKSLTKRESEVLVLVCNGMNNPEIAQALYISENTVKRHLNNIFQKAEVKNRYELISGVLKRPY